MDENSTKPKFWPTPQDYNEAVQNLKDNVSDPDLKSGEVDVNRLGLPFVRSGAFASAYKVTSGGRTWALRCFLRRVGDIAERYERISEFIRKDNLACTVDFDYQPQGIRIGGEWFPILKMAWIEGETLDRYIANRNGEISPALAESFREMCMDMQTFGLAHGDLQHGNIIVRDEQLFLVDYDGMFVPRLSGWKSNELGHPNYQHPKRAAANFDARLDTFSAWHIYLSLQALAVEPKFYGIPTAWDESLLFNRKDFAEPTRSFVFALLERYDHPGIRQLAKFIRWQLGLELDQLPEFGRPILVNLPLTPVQFNFADTILEEIAVQSPPPAPTPVIEQTPAVEPVINLPATPLSKNALQPPDFNTLPPELLTPQPRHVAFSGNVSFEREPIPYIFGSIAFATTFIVFVLGAAKTGDSGLGAITIILASLVAFIFAGAFARTAFKKSRPASYELLKWGSAYPGRVVARKGPFQTHAGSGKAYRLEYEAYDARGQVIFTDWQIVDAANRILPNTGDVVAVVHSSRTGERGIYEVLDGKIVTP